MKSILSAFAAALAAAGAAVAQPAPPPGAPPIDLPESETPPEEPAVHQDSAGRLTAFARKTREEKGCAAAAPAYRVIAGMGEGNEAAQHELGECLLDIDGASATETALFRQEGEFWLTRAAYAGNARAQRRLVTEMAAPASALHDPKAALQWALVYAKNPTSDLYGYKALPPTLVPGLRASLTPEAIAEAESFAATFVPVALAKFEAPKREKAKGDPRRPPPGARPRRPGIGG
jgi:TPR repeat protein